MNRFLKPIQAVLTLMILTALSSCTIGQAASPTPTAVDVKVIMTSAAATAFVELTKIAGQASPTPAPTQAPTMVPATKAPVEEAINTPDAALAGSATQNPALPSTETPVVAAVGGTPGATATRNLTPIGPAVPTSNAPTCLNSQFVGDITIPDGTVMVPYQKFTKIWAVKNTGICAWDEGFGAVLTSGPDMGGGPQYLSIHDQEIEPGGTWDVVVEMRAPVQPGEYIAHWKMISDSGQFFGGDLTVVIKVVQ